jgi:23S rRNA (adenine2030-N6)-methyltransferase
MNYRHAFHAGNFADCMKHAVLVWLLRAMARKAAAFSVLDTHAGAGRYDLAADPAERTGEWRAGIGRLLDDPPPPLADYVALVGRCGLYPGSPALTRALLRPQDRLVCCELHPEEHAALRRAYAHDRQVAVHLRDAWEALGALLPPEEKRGVVLVDPPYEASDEYERLVAGLLRGHARFPSGVFVAWYPVKHLAPVRALHTALRESGVRDVVAAELNLREPLDPARLNGCGLLVINPPYRFEAEVPALLEALLRRLGTGEAGAGVAVERLVDE